MTLVLNDLSKMCINVCKRQNKYHTTQSYHLPSVYPPAEAMSLE